MNAQATFQAVGMLTYDAVTDELERWRVVDDRQSADLKVWLEVQGKALRIRYESLSATGIYSVAPEVAMRAFHHPFIYAP